MASTVKEKDNVCPSTLTFNRFAYTRMFRTSVSLKYESVGYAMLSCILIDVQSLGKLIARIRYLLASTCDCVTHTDYKQNM